jgi:Glyoxalase-like domain
VLLGGAYLELVAVIDPAQAAASVFGRWASAAPPGHPMGWAVRTDELDAVAAGLGLAVADGARAAPDGRVLRWRTAGLERAAAEPCLPFFIEWAEGTELPGGTAVTHPAGPARIAGLRLSGDPKRLADWLGGHTLPIEISAGRRSCAA